MKSVKSPRRRLYAVLAICASLAASLSACSSSTSSGESGGESGGGGTSSASASATKPTAKIRVSGLWSEPDMTQLPYAVGIERGIYAAHGIEASVVLPPDYTSGVKFILQGKAEIAETTNSDVIFGRAQNLPIKSIGDLTQVNNFVMFAKAGHPINASTVRGKKIGVFNDTFSETLLPLMLKGMGLTTKDVTLIKSDNNFPLVAEGKVDFGTNVTNFTQPIMKQLTGQDPTMEPATKYGAPEMPVWTNTASDSWLSSHADEAKRFLAATAEAMQWSAANPTEAIALYNTYFKLNLNAADLESNLEQWKVTATILRGSLGLLTSSDEMWTGFANVLKDSGQIKTVLPASDYYTNDYLGDVSAK